MNKIVRYKRYLTNALSGSFLSCTKRIELTQDFIFSLFAEVLGDVEVIGIKVIPLSEIRS